MAEVAGNGRTKVAGGRLRVGHLRERLAHHDADAIVAVQLRHHGESPWWADENGPELALVTEVAGASPSDVVPEPIGTDPVTEGTVAVVILTVWMGGQVRDREVTE